LPGDESSLGLREGGEGGDASAERGSFSVKGVEGALGNSEAPGFESGTRSMLRQPPQRTTCPTESSSTRSKPPQTGQLNSIAIAASST
jgi:hypothetical protein